MNPRSIYRRGFTLIEMLTVIAIMAILAALLFPAVKIAIIKGEASQARGDIKNIEHAIKSYVNEYGVLPTKDQGAADTYYNSGTAFNIYNILRATGDTTFGTSTDYNPRKIVFLETPGRKNAFDSNGNFVDPWGQVYYIKLDCDYNNLLDYYGNQTNVAAVVVSYGPNGAQEDPNLTKSDDIVNYK